jgi:dynein light chain Tctex-type 1
MLALCLLGCFVMSRRTICTFTCAPRRVKMSTEHFEFPQLSEVATKTALDVMFKILESKKYTASKTAEWADLIGNQIIEKMRATAPYFKYLVTCFIVEKVGAGLHYESVSHWDPKTDGSITAKFENDSIICLCTVAGVAI